MKTNIDCDEDYPVYSHGPKYGWPTNIPRWRIWWMNRIWKKYNKMQDYLEIKYQEAINAKKE